METGGQITVNAFENKGMVIVEIIDNGKGMSESQLRMIGTPFYSTKEKGTGVGLTISYQLIQSMKGNIMVESKVGQGTKFTIQFPKYLEVDSDIPDF
ncbi:sensor histidine kinase [Bacillus sp. M6-12]|uniref:sensor histidine kinase n=1 Tax=Bacillus sp. M6-12 TaxID=2054166 RepID=UPI002154F7F2|nr:HAMP domain-containing sensor histidine kinase [Bacillus sp. M6-12]